MEQQLISFFEQLGIWAILFSIVINIIVAVLGLVPSFFITAANIAVYGPFGGFILSLVGESLGAVVSFTLYRKGFKEGTQKLLAGHAKINQLVNATPSEAFKLIIALRMFPYAPSGLVTYFASVGKIGTMQFTIASTLGKIPAMVIEVVLVYSVMQLPMNSILALISVSLIVYIVYKNFKKTDKEN